MTKRPDDSKGSRITGSRSFGIVALILWLGMLGFAIRIFARNVEAGSVLFLAVSVFLVILFSVQLIRQK